MSCCAASPSPTTDWMVMRPSRRLGSPRVRLTALPAYFGAVDGVTADGDPVGSLAYTVICVVVAGLSIAAAATVNPADVREQEAAVGSGASAARE